MTVIREIARIRETLAAPRRAGAGIGLVPTMGALHEGHGALMEAARRECGCVVASIFVNPIQFNDASDFQRYPRTWETDTAFCAARGVDLVFAPATQEMYPRPLRTSVEVAGLSAHLCGAFRPGHFAGVATVVAKLFQIVQPDRAYFGQKDAQQLAIIRRMVEDLSIPVEIVAVPIVREPDGLALSSRNRLLSAAERGFAPAIYRALQAAAQRIAGGETCPEALRRDAVAQLETRPGVRVEYFEAVDPEEMTPVTRVTGPVRLAAAVWVGQTRLIDNLLAEPSEHATHSSR